MSTPPAIIDSDLPCHTCGYNLRTLPAAASCPECNTPVADAVRFHQLNPPLPHGRIATAALFMFIAGLLAIAFRTYSTLFFTVLPARIPVALYFLPYGAVLLINISLSTAAILLVIHLAPPSFRRSGAATFFFFALVATILLVLILATLTLFAAVRPGFAFFYRGLAMFISILAILSSMVINIYSYLFLYHLSRRPQYHALRPATAPLALTSLALDACALIHGVAGFYFYFGPPARQFTLVGTLITLARIALGLCFLTYWFVLRRVARRQVRIS